MARPIYWRRMRAGWHRLIRSDGEAYLLAADACWLARAYQENRPPHALANLLFSDAHAYRETLADLHHYHQRQPGVHIIPSHCAETLARFAVIA
jgi:hypothetical protein